MSLQIEHKTEKGTLCFVKLSDDVIDVDLIYTPKSLELRGITKDGGWWYSDEIQIGFVKIGFTSDITEQQAKNMGFDYVYDGTDDINIKGLIYECFDDSDFTCKNALDSFKSLMQHLNVFEVNTYGPNEPNLNQYDLSNASQDYADGLEMEIGMNRQQSARNSWKMDSII